MILEMIGNAKKWASNTKEQPKMKMIKEKNVKWPKKTCSGP